MRRPSRILARALLKAGALIILSVSLLYPLAAADDCASLQAAVDALRARIKTDQTSILQNKIATKLTADELDRWTQATAEEQRKIFIKRLADIGGTLLGEMIALSSEQLKANLLKPTVIAGYPLPNGVGSLGTGQANAIIGALQSRGVNSNSPIGAVLIRCIRQVSFIQNKTQAINILSDLPSVLKSTADVTNSDSAATAAAAAFQLLADCAGRYQLAVAIGNAIFAGGRDIVDGLILSFGIDSLATASELQLNALKVLTANLQQHVQALQSAKARLGGCSTNFTGTQIVYFPPPASGLGWIEVEWPESGGLTANPQGWVAIGFIQGATRAGCDRTNGGHLSSTYSPSGKPVRTNSSVVVQSCVLGSPTSILPGAWQIVACAAHRGDRDYPFGADKGEFVSGRDSVAFYGGASCVNCRQVPDPQSPGNRSTTKTVCTPTPPLFTTTVVIEPPSHACALVQIR
jgi:hypothetical protein